MRSILALSVVIAVVTWLLSLSLSFLEDSLLKSIVVVGDSYVVFFVTGYLAIVFLRNLFTFSQSLVIAFLVSAFTGFIWLWYSPYSSASLVTFAAYLIGSTLLSAAVFFLGQKFSKLTQIN